MGVYLDELSEDVRGNFPAHLRLKNVRGVEVGDHLFQVVVADFFNSEAYLAGSVAIKVNEKKKEIRWDSYFPNAYVFVSRKDLSLPRGGGFGVYVHALSLLVMSERIDNARSYNVCSNEGASVERLGQMERLGLESVMSYDDNLEAVLGYMRKWRGVDVKGVCGRDGVYKFLFD